MGVLMINKMKAFPGPGQLSVCRMVGISSTVTALGLSPCVSGGGGWVGGSPSSNNLEF
jgi:hypothetical protein